MRKKLFICFTSTCLHYSGNVLQLFFCKKVLSFMNNNLPKWASRTKHRRELVMQQCRWGIKIRPIIITMPKNTCSMLLRPYLIKHFCLLLHLHHLQQYLILAVLELCLATVYISIHYAAGYVLTIKLIRSQINKGKSRKMWEKHSKCK